MNSGRRGRVRAASLLLAPLLVIGVLTGCGGSASDDPERGAAETDEPESTPTEPTEPEPEVEVDPIVGPTLQGSIRNVIPKPNSSAAVPATFAIRSDTVVVVPDDLDEARDAAELLRESIGRAADADLPIRPRADGHTSIRFRAMTADEGTDPVPEWYSLDVSDTEIVIEAADHDGFVWAVQTLRQLLPAAAAADEPADGTLVVPGVSITDSPRYRWRGAMLDITRHWFGPEDVRAYIDQISLYKINRLHLHLSDDQGWRIEIRSHPELTEIGSTNEVGGGPGGHLTQDDYRDLVHHAAARGVVIVPEIDTPGHTNAALRSLPELACDGIAPEPYTGTQVGFSTVCVDSEFTYEWFDDVIGELAELTPGPWIHLGGDEADSTSDEDYATFIGRAVDIVRSHGKTPIGWDEIGNVDIGDDVLVQHWSHTTDSTLAAAEGGAGVIMSPHARTYLDMRHHAEGSGNRWAGDITAELAWDWDPDTIIDGLDPTSVEGIEAPLWTELIDDLETIRLRTLPRLPAFAEVGWSEREGRDWEDASRRLVAHRPLWDILGWAHTTDDPSLPAG